MRSLWLGISLLLNALSAVGLWHFFGGRMRSAWIAVGVAAPNTADKYTPLMLVGLTLFLLSLRAQRWTLAGVSPP